MQSSSFLRSQQHHDSLLHRVFFHPNINTLVLKFMTTTHVLNVLCVDKALYNYLPSIISELDMNITTFEWLNFIGHVFKNVHKMKICSGNLKNELVISEKQFPNLLTTELREINTPLICITTQVLRELCIKEDWNYKIGNVFPVCKSLRKITGKMRKSIAKKLLESQPELEVIEVKIMKNDDNDIEYKINVELNQESLRKIQIDADNNMKIYIHSLEKIEHLHLTTTDVIVKDHVPSSPMRWMYLFFSRPSQQAIFGNTKFPHLNLFFTYPVCQQPNIIRIYDECLAKDQDQVSLFCAEKTCIQVLFDSILYCNGCVNINNLICTETKNNVFVKNTPDLTHLYVCNFNAELHLVPKCLNLQNVQFVLDSKTFAAFHVLLQTQQILELLMITTDTLWNRLSKPLLQNVLDLLKIRIHSNSNSIDIEIEDLPTLKKLEIDHVSHNSILNIKCNNLPLVSTMSFGHYIQRKHTTTSIANVFIDRLPSLCKIKTDFWKHDIIYGNQQTQQNVEITKEVYK